MSTVGSKQGRVQAASSSLELELSSTGRDIATPLSGDSLVGDSLVHLARADVATGVEHAGPGANVELVLL